MRNRTTVAVIGFLGMALAWLAVGAAVAGPQEPPPPPRDLPGRNPQSPLSPSNPQASKQLVKMRMAADVARIKPGEKFHLAFIFEIEPQWHIYWENAGSSGTPTEIKVTAPLGFTVGRTLYPRPEQISSDEGPTYAYEGTTVLLVEVTPPTSALASVTFSGKAGWLVCKDICKMGSASDSLTLPFGTPAVPSATDESPDPIVDQFKQRVPRLLEKVNTAVARFEGTTLLVSVPAQKFDTAEFFPADTPGVEYGQPTIEKNGGHLNLTIPIKVEPNNALGKPLRIAGVVGLGTSQEDPSFEFEIPLAADGRPRSE